MAIGKIQELRVMAPASEKTVAIELNGKVYFPLQDHRFNICALQDRGGKIAQWCRYLAFGTKTTYGDLSINNPWGFSNRREVAGLVQFTHRFYRPTLKRWLTTDPLSFEEDLNLYTYVKNNPHVFMDPDGRYAIFLLPLFEIAFGIGEATVVCVTLGDVLATIGVALAICEGTQMLDAYLESSEEGIVIDPARPTPQGQQQGGHPSDYNMQDFPADSTQPPADGFEWRGSGEPGSKGGAWYNPETEESLRADLDHPHHGPHWDYKNKQTGVRARLYPNGRWELKNF